jgi:hypothetical protein
VQSTHAVSARATHALTPCPTTPRPRTWLREIITGGQTIETCSAWCAVSHDADRVGMLDDLVHAADEHSLVLPGFDESSAILSARVQVDPYDTDPRRNVPHVLFEPARDDVMGGLSPEEFVAVIGQVRAHLDLLEQTVLAQLVQARAEHAGQSATA